MNFKEFFLSLDSVSRARYAKRARTTTGYIAGHLLNRYKVPRKALMINLAKASNGAITLQDLINFFYKG